MKERIDEHGYTDADKILPQRKCLSPEDCRKHQESMAWFRAHKLELKKKYPKHNLLIKDSKVVAVYTGNYIDVAQQLIDEGHQPGTFNLETTSDEPIAYISSAPKRCSNSGDTKTSPPKKD